MRTVSVLLTGMLGFCAFAQENRPNVIVMIADDLGYGDVSCLSHGLVKTPNIDRLAAMGITFTAGHVTAPLCAPSRAGFFTGRYQQRFGFLNNEGSIPLNVPLLPGVLRAAGYHTGLMGKWHSEGPMPYARGCFDETLTAPKSSPWVDYFDPPLAKNGKVSKWKGYSTDILTQEAESFIERNKGNPFSLTVTFNAPHIGPLKVPAGKIRAAYDAARAAGKVYDVPKTPTARPGEAARYTSLFPGDTARADTVATIAALDGAVGRILDKLQQTGVVSNTAVFFFADNGGHPENRSENGALRDYKWSHYEGGIRVPFFAAYPKVFPAGLAYDKPVSTLDIYPTVMALTGVKPPSGLDGVNLVPYLKGEKTGSPHESLFFLTGDKGAVIQDRWKLVVFPQAAPQLFDLTADIGEARDLAATNTNRVSDLLAKWKTWKAQMSPVASKRPNVLLLFSDQHNADAMGCAGHPIVKTPQLDALAKKGVRFTRTYCQDAICVPSRISMMTGLYPRTTGILTNGDEDHILDARNLSPLQQAFQAAGYFTVAAGKFHLGKKQIVKGWDRGATVLPLKMDPVQESYFDWIREKGYEAAHQRDWNGSMKSDLGAHISDVPDEFRSEAYTAGKAISFIKEAVKQESPFFCWASFHGPHQPYTPTKRWADLYPLESIPLPDSVNEPLENLPPDLQNWRRNEKTPWNLAKAARDPLLYKRYIANYYAQVSEVDHYLGQVLACLDELGVRENTIVIYASDHGDFVGRHGMAEKCAIGHNVYEETLHVPLIISWPKHFQQNVKCDSLAELVDIYPTVAELVKLQRPAGILPLAGRSLVSTLTEGKPTGRQYAFSENWSQATVIGERYKLGVWQDPSKAYARWDWRGKTRDQLYDRQSDPQELNNLIGKPELAAIEKELRHALTEWQRSMPSADKNNIGAD